MKIRITAAALCCLLFGASVALTSCGLIADRLSEYERDRQDDTNQGALTYTERTR